jgi:broad specificity phosphatase PhoE
LSDEGLLAIERLKQSDFWSNINHIYTNTEQKAIQDALLIGEKFGHTIIKKSCLNENDRSSTGFMPYDEFMRNIYTFFANPHESQLGWETAVDATDRIVSCINQIAQTVDDDDNVAIIGHGVVFGLFLCHLKNKAPDFKETQKDLGSLIHIDWTTKTINKPWTKY